MEGEFKLPNGHLLNLNPRPRNNNKSKRQPAATADSKPSQSREHSNEIEGKTTTRSESKDPNAMPQSSPSGALATKLPMPKSLIDKGKGKMKDKQPYVEDEEDENPGYKPVHKSDTPSSTSTSTPEKSTGKNHEQHWCKLRGKFDKDSPLMQKSKEKQKEFSQGAYRKIMSLANGPRNETSKNKLKYGELNASDTKLPVRGATGIPSPSNQGRSASGGITRAPAIRHPPKQKKQQQQQEQEQKEQHATPRSKNFSSRQTSDSTDNTTDSSTYSQHSTSSVSGHASSNTDWEDKFVVNMPSAKEPSPPFLTAHQIFEFQKSMERVRREGGDMVHPDTCPSPHTTTPEGKVGSADTTEQTSSGRDGLNSDNKSQNKTNDNSTNPPLQYGRYYSPEEIGKKRCSTIWEEGPSKTKQKIADANADGSFLGCKEINGPGEKNPDEILFFSTTTERPKVVDVSVPISRKPRAKAKSTGRRMPGASDDNTMAYKEWRLLSDNLMNGGKCSKPSKTMCQEPICQPQGKDQAPSKAPGKENSHIPNPPQPDSKNSQKDDEVFMNTPTVSCAPVTVKGRTNAQRSSSSQLPQGSSQATGDSMPKSRAPLSRSPPSGLRPGIRRPRDKPNNPSESPADLTSIPINKTRGQAERNLDSPRSIRGIMRFPGMSKPFTGNFTENMRANARQSSMPIPMNRGSSGQRRSISGPPQVVSESSSESVSPVSSIIPEKHGDTEDPSARIVGVAELDGQQLQREAEQKTQNTTTDSSDGAENIQPDNGSKDAVYPLTLTLIFDILILSIAYVQSLSSEFLGTEYPQVILGSVLKMLEHCAHVSRHISYALSTYRSTGSWSKSGNEDLRHSLTDIAQAIVYLFALGFMMLIIGRAAGYVVIVGSWVVWLAKPFGWAFGLVAKALLP